MHHDFLLVIYGAYLVFQLWTHAHLYNKLHPAQRKHLRLQSLGPVTRSFNPQIPFEFDNFQAIWINKTKDWLNISFNSPGVLSEAWVGLILLPIV
ncbi:hypothetical protein BY996DRAFT_7144965 [Phakopsora pachyrhizi]|nr:hypothetical protein BY996DRAFT_7158304 [Phakopsora pachyrhizi]KAI8453623.1 hypothetical protein BY996DRAFT_7144965 [Phakopsora pachyrhizi]